MTISGILRIRSPDPDRSSSQRRKASVWGMSVSVSEWFLWGEK